VAAESELSIFRGARCVFFYRFRDACILLTQNGGRADEVLPFIFKHLKFVI
jgi:hypothetical protein